MRHRPLGRKATIQRLGPMRISRSGRCAASALVLMAGWPLLEPRAVGAHPLDGLSPAEMTATVEILKADGKITDAARFPLIELKEPEKSVVLAWSPGKLEPRAATVN